MNYFIIGLTSKDAIAVQRSLEALSTIALENDLELAQFRRLGLRSPFRREVIEVRYVSRVERAAYKKLTGIVGGEYLSFLLLNETAKTVADLHGHELPRVLSVIHDSEVPHESSSVFRLPYTIVVLA